MEWDDRKENLIWSDSKKAIYPIFFPSKIVTHIKELDWGPANEKVCACECVCVSEYGCVSESKWVYVRKKVYEVMYLLANVCSFEF